MFAGAYWMKRPESREQAGDRLAAFFKVLPRVSDRLTAWFLKGRTRADALNKPLDLGSKSLARVLKANRRDTDLEAMPELGLHLGIWNGKTISFAATIGARSSAVPNSAVLSDESAENGLDEDSWRRILNAMIDSFNPDHAAVVNPKVLSSAGSAHPWDVGWLVYTRGRGLTEQSSNRRLQ